MTHKTTITDNYILITSDEEIKFDDWVYNRLGVLFQYGIEHTLHPSTKKVIAHLPLGMYSNLEGVPLLPPLPSGEDDVEKMAECFIKEEVQVASPSLNSGIKLGFEEGWKKHSEKYRFTEEDILNALEFGFELGKGFDIDNPNQGLALLVHTKDTYIQSLSQPKMPTSFSPNMVCDQCNGDESTDSCYCHHGSYKIVPKIINGVMQGEWIY